MAWAEHLSPVNAFEKAWLPVRRLDDGHYTSSIHP
jgi:hypothetical protein